MARLFQREADRCGSWFNDPHNARFAFRYSCGKAAASPTPLTVCVRAIQARRSGCSLPDRDHAAGLDGTDAGGEQHLHRRASKSRSARAESSGSIANTTDPRSFSQGRWLGEMPPAGGVISTTSPPCSCRSIPAPAASWGSCKAAWMKRFSSPCPRRSWIPRSSRQSCAMPWKTATTGSSATSM